MDWSVGYTGPIRISTRLDDEREIDIDDRSANLVVEIEMLETAVFALEARNLVVTLNFDFSDPGAPLRDPAISFGGAETGPYQLITAAQNVTLRPGAKITRTVTVRTGAFSRTQISATTPSATPGRKEVDAVVEFELAPIKQDNAEFIERDVTLQFVVAED